MKRLLLLLGFSSLKMLRVWNGMTGELVSEQLLPTSLDNTLMYAESTDPNGKYLARITNESIGLYDAVTKKLIREWDRGYGASQLHTKLVRN